MLTAKGAARPGRGRAFSRGRQFSPEQLVGCFLCPGRPESTPSIRNERLPPAPCRHRLLACTARGAAFCANWASVFLGRNAHHFPLEISAERARLLVSERICYEAVQDARLSDFGVADQAHLEFSSGALRGYR